MRPRTIRTAFYITALLWAAFAAPRAARADSGPAISSLTPSSLAAGSGGFTLTIAGSGFDKSSQVAFNNDTITPTSITASQITVVVPSADVANGGYASVIVTTAAGASPFKVFTVENAAPQISGLTPSTAYAGGNFFTLTLFGSGFNAETRVLFGPDRLTPDTVAPTRLTVTVPAGEIVAAASVAVSAVNPDPVVGTSNSQTFIISAPTPVISSISPNTAVAGASDTAITITGQNFNSASSAQWNGAALTTTYVSATSLKATIPAADLATAGTANVTVADPNYGVSAPATFTVTTTMPTAATLSPSSANSGDPDFTLTVNGANFQSGSIIKWENTALSTTFVSATKLTATVPAASVWSPTTVPITVSTPINGKTVTTAPLTFTVNTSVPTLTSLSPASKVEKSPAFTLTITGSKFLKGVTINWNGAALPTTLVSSVTLTASITADKVATPGTASITLTNPGGSPSSPLTFQITAHGAPSIASITPNTAVAGSGDTKITIAGAGFTKSCAAQWNGVALPTTFVSETSLTATIPAANLTAATAASITVSDPDFGASAPAAFTVTAPLPIVAALSPSAVSNGSPDFTLTVSGTNFVSSSTIKWGNTPLATTFVSATKLTATVTAASVANPATVPVTVSSIVSGKAVTTSALTFTINPSSPTITALSPPSQYAGGPAFTLTVTGSKFLKGVTINWNGAALPTTIVSGATLTAPVSADKIATVGTASITLVNAGAAPSSALTFQILAQPAPKLTALSPNTATAGSSDTKLTVTGANFTSASAIQWNGAALSTTFVSSTTLTATIPAANLKTAATINVAVADAKTGVSVALPFTITTPLPTAASLSPSSANSGDPDFTLTVKGANFQSGAIVKWGNTALTTTFVSATQVTATVPAGYVWLPTTAPITVSMTVNGKAAATNALTFTVNASTPAIAGLSPASATAGGAAFTLTVRGSKFLKGATINWNGAALSTTLVSSAMLTAPITASMIATTGTAAVTLTNTGAAPSQPLTFQILAPPTPKIAGLSPSVVPAMSSSAGAIGANTGAAGVPVAVSGANFTNASVVLWNGAKLPTMFVSDTMLHATVPAAYLSGAATADITISDPNGVSSSLPFTVTAATPALASLAPSSVASGGTDLALTVNGSDFQSSSVIKWGNTTLSTTFVSATQLTATVPAGYVWSPGAITVTISTPINGKTVTTSALTFTVSVSTPTIASLTPVSAVSGGAAFTLTVRGSKFLNGVVIQWNGAALPTTIVSSAMLTAPITATQIAAAGAATVTLVNPGGAPSPALTFQISAPAATTPPAKS